MAPSSIRSPCGLVERGPNALKSCLTAVRHDELLAPILPGRSRNSGQLTNYFAACPGIEASLRNLPRSAFRFRPTANLPSDVRLTPTMTALMPHLLHMSLLQSATSLACEADEATALRRDAIAFWRRCGGCRPDIGASVADIIAGVSDLDEEMFRSFRANLVG